MRISKKRTSADKRCKSDERECRIKREQGMAHAYGACIWRMHMAHAMQLCCGMMFKSVIFCLLSASCVFFVVVVVVVALISCLILLASVTGDWIELDWTELELLFSDINKNISFVFSTICGFAVVASPWMWMAAGCVPQLGCGWLDG